MKLFTPAIRISLVLVLFTLSIILAADALFKLSDEDTDTLLETRKIFCETLAVQSTLLIQQGDEVTLAEIISVTVENNPDVLSVALHDTYGREAILVGDHENYWVDMAPDKSTINQVQIPIFDGEDRWGTLQVRFKLASLFDALNILHNPFVKLILFVAIVGFIVYSWFIRKTLHYLNPSSLIPGRVKTALDGLVEGVLMLDTQGYIVLANKAFSENINIPFEDLIGVEAAQLDWLSTESNSKPNGFPWMYTIEQNKIHSGVNIKYKKDTDTEISLVVHCSPIQDGKGKVSGALASFENVTELEATNKKLIQTVHTLEKTQAEVAAQNIQLKELATRDPMTGCLNRRAFFDLINPEFDTARENNRKICCIMADIDHFKKFNDTYGHSTGDDVIKIVAKKLGLVLRTNDLLCRYGGEEFCIMLIDIEMELATVIAERMRNIIETEAAKSIRSISGISITMSFGVSSIKPGADKPETLIDEADSALYVSKNLGRNCVTNWNQSMISTNENVVTTTQH